MKRCLLLSVCAAISLESGEVLASSASDPVARTRHLAPDAALPAARSCQASIDRGIEPKDMSLYLETAKQLRLGASLERDEATAAALGKIVEASDPTALSGEQAAALAAVEHDLKVCLETTRALAPVKSELRAVASGASAGGLAWQSAVIDGLAAFIADRTQAELALWIVENFKHRLCATSRFARTPILKAKVQAATTRDELREPWFPETCELSDGGDAAEVPGSAFISALREDLEQLPYALLRELLVRRKVGEDDAQDLTDSARAVGGAIAEMRGGTSAKLAIAGLARVSALQGQCARDPRVHRFAALGCSLAVTGLLMQRAIDRCAGGDCASDATRLAGDAALRDLIAGWTDDASVGARLGSLAGHLETFIVWLDHNPPSGSGPGARLDYARDLTLQVLTLVRGVLTVSYAGAPPPQAEYALIGLEAVDAMLRGDYARGVRGAVKLLDAILAVAGATRRDPDALQELRKYVVLVADLAAAKDSQAVSAAISAAAAPVGGWRLKRKRFTVSLSALVGLSGSGEYIAARKNLGFTVAPLAALGLDFSGPVGRHGWTLGAFGSILDLGQLVSARLGEHVEKGEEGAATASEVALVSILSPGAYFKVGVGRSPFTFGAGVAYAPAMRTVYYASSDAAGGVTGDAFAALRFGVFVAVDVTIFPFVRARRRS